ncbi:MAG: hypothetical protein ACI9MR_000521 [Myxococcota bacterium]|jgi:hypothetical protein
MTDSIPELRASVAEAIRAAFADGETPPSPPMVSADKRVAFFRSGRSAYYHSLEAGFQRLMADPTQVGLDEHAPMAQDLKPSAERWFWRTYLLAALEAPWGDPSDDEQTRSLVHSTTYWLRPNLSAVLAGRADHADAQDLRERFNADQRVAVARFLGLILAAPMLAGTIYAYSATQVIAWCWTDDPATTRASEALRSKARSYQRPPADNSLNADLIRAIETAFEDTPAPVAPLMESLVCGEDFEHAIEFQGTRWQTLAPWFLNFHSSAFYTMTPAAFRYFLPAAMCHRLGAGTEVELDFHLVDCVLDPSSYRDSARDRVLAFSRDERNVVTEFLRASRRHGRDSPCPIRTAVVDFWDPDSGLQREDSVGSND